MVCLQKQSMQKLYALFMWYIKKKDMTKEEKMKSIELINNFRKEIGQKPY